MPREIAMPGAGPDGNGGEQRPYDGEHHNFHGQEVLIHDTAGSFATALRQERPDGRIFTYASASFLFASQECTFIDGQRRVHGFSVNITSNERTNSIQDTIWGAITACGAEETDGKIKVDDKTGHVYQIYETDTPEVEGRIDAQVQAWTEDVRAASAINPSDGVLQYINTGDATIIDFTQGRNHKITVLHHTAGHTLDSVVEQLPPIPQQDNGPVLRWAEIITP